MSSLNKKSTWPRQAAIVISDSPNIHMLLRELLRAYNWTVADSMPSVETAAAALRQGFAYLVIIDDSAVAPSAKALRYLLGDVVGVTTPTLCFTLEAHKQEAPALQRIGRPALVDKPLTPAKFLPGFVSLVKAWESEPLVSLRRASYQYMNSNEAQCLKALLKLAEMKETSAMASQALSLHLRRLGKIKEAEKILLNALKRAPRDLSTMLLLADLYLHSGMPRLAHRVLTSARNAFPDSMTVLIDSVQASIMTGQTPEAIEHLFAMQRRGFMADEVNDFLARLLYAEGREAETEKVLNNNKVSLKRIQTSWANAETVPTQPSTTPASA